MRADPARLEARRLGLKRYSNGRPCPKGHIGERFVSNNGCCQCTLERTTHWRADNPDRDAECRRISLRRYYAAHREKHLRECAEYRRANAETKRARDRAYREQHPEIVARSKKLWAEVNRHAVLKRNQAWRAENRHRDRQNKRKYKNLKANGAFEYPSEALADAARREMIALYEAAERRTVATGVAYQVDHIFPVSRGGMHVPWNLQVLTAKANREKYAKLPDVPTHAWWHGYCVCRLRLTT